MMDWSSLVDEPFHPIYNVYSLDGEYELDIRNRSQGNVRYYFIDFGLSTWFENQDTPTLVTGQDGREQNAPELHAGKPYDPFKVDIFILGAFLERDLVKVCVTFKWAFVVIKVLTTGISWPGVSRAFASPNDKPNPR